MFRLLELRNVNGVGVNLHQSELGSITRVLYFKKLSKNFDSQMHKVLVDSEI